MALKAVASRQAGRPKSKEKRGAILDAASRLFLAHGLRNTSMDAVASEADVSKQTVYSHFESKEALFRAVIECKVAQHQMQPSQADIDAPLRDGLIRIGEHLLELIYDPEALRMFRVVIGESGDHGATAKLFYEAGPEQGIRAVVAFLEAHDRAGRLHLDDARHAAVLFSNMLKGEEHMRLLMGLGKPPGKSARQKHAARCVDAFLAIYGV